VFLGGGGVGVPGRSLGHTWGEALVDGVLFFLIGVS
jgi:hypothetical protein